MILDKDGCSRVDVLLVRRTSQDVRTFGTTVEALKYPQEQSISSGTWSPSGDIDVSWLSSLQSGIKTTWTSTFSRHVAAA